MSPVSEVIRDYFEQYTLFRYQKGQILVFNGERSNYVYYLLEGRVKVYDVSYRGDEIVVHVYKPGDFFPVSHLFGRTKNPYIYESDSVVTIRRAPAGDIFDLFALSPDVTLSLLTQAYNYIEAFLDRQALLMAGSARSKLIYELMVQCRQFGTQIDDDCYELDINEKDLGARAGLSRETVNREARKLKRENLIRLERKRIIIPSIDKLEKKLGRAI